MWRFQFDLSYDRTWDPLHNSFIAMSKLCARIITTEVTMISVILSEIWIPFRKVIISACATQNIWALTIEVCAVLAKPSEARRCFGLYDEISPAKVPLFSQCTRRLFIFRATSGSGSSRVLRGTSRLRTRASDLTFLGISMYFPSRQAAGRYLSWNLGLSDGLRPSWPVAFKACFKTYRRSLS